MIDLGPQNGPQNAPKSSPRGPQDALGARLPLEVGFGAIFGPFWDPSGPRKSCSRCGAVLFLLILRHAPPNGPKIEPKTTPGGPRMARNVAPNRCSNFDQISIQNHSKIGLRAQGPPRARPEASREPFGRHSGLILASIRSLRGLMVYCWCSFSLASSPPLLAF